MRASRPENCARVSGIGKALVHDKDMQDGGVVVPLILDLDAVWRKWPPS